VTTTVALPHLRQLEMNSPKAEKDEPVRARSSAHYLLGGLRVAAGPWQLSEPLSLLLRLGLASSVLAATAVTASLAWRRH
jgi:hypothetical protein